MFIPGKGQDRNTPEDRYLHSRIEQRQLDRGQWADLTEGIDYTEKKRRKERQNPEQSNSGGNERSYNPIFGEGTGAAFARFLLITLGAIAIALLVRSILGYGRIKDKKITRNTEAGINIQKIEENIHEADLEDYIDQAKVEGNFNLAIRLYYLAILKELSLQKIIKWKVDKTNSQYLWEMRGHDQVDEFRTLTRIFERSWYGDRLLDAASFAELEPKFQRFISLLTPAKPMNAL